MGEFIKIPQGWSIKEIQELGKVITGSTPKTGEEENWIGTLPFVSPTDLTGSKYLQSTERQVNKNVINKNRLIPKNSIMYTCIASIGKMSISNEECTTNQQINTIIPSKEFDHNFIYYSLLYKTNYIKTLSAMTAVPIINKGLFSKIKLTIPPAGEQQKIAAILSSVDEAIEKTEQIIEQTEKVKKGLMQELLTKGIGHTEFKDSPVGKVPKEWKIVNLGDVLKLIKRPINMHDDSVYDLITVKRRYGGITSRGQFKGKDIKVKSQFLIKEGDFLISKRQIVHGACEVVPTELDGSIVSNEYHTLLTKDNLNIDFFRWLVRSPRIQHLFLLSSVGVHIEKMLFRLDDWFKWEIALPFIEEQENIARLLSKIELRISREQQKVYSLQSIKQGLMQELLTGKKRVKVDDSKEVLS